MAREDLATRARREAEIQAKKEFEARERRAAEAAQRAEQARMREEVKKSADPPNKPATPPAAVSEPAAADVKAAPTSAASTSAVPTRPAPELPAPQPTTPPADATPAEPSPAEPAVPPPEVAVASGATATAAAEAGSGAVPSEAADPVVTEGDEVRPVILESSLHDATDELTLVRRAQAVTSLHGHWASFTSAMAEQLAAMEDERQSIEHHWHAIERKRQMAAADMNAMLADLAAREESVKEQIETQRCTALAEIAAASKALEDEKARIGNLMNFGKGKVKLDVGGTHFHTSVSTLTAEPESLLASMFSGRYTLMPDDADGSFFIDRDGATFKYILNHLRSISSGSSYELPADQEMRAALLNDALYYQLPRLIEVLSGTAVHFRAQQFLDQGRSILYADAQPVSPTANGRRQTSPVPAHDHAQAQHSFRASSPGRRRETRTMNSGYSSSPRLYAPGSPNKISMN